MQRKKEGFFKWNKKENFERILLEKNEYPFELTLTYVINMITRICDLISKV